MNWFEDRKTVVPIDFSDESNYAVDVALKINHQPEDLFLVHVSPELIPIGLGVAYETLDYESQKQHLEREFKKHFSDSKYRGVNYTSVFGDPGHQIADYAESIQAGLIVMPSHGRTGLKRILIGSVAERVVRLAHCPVLVLRQ